MRHAFTLLEIIFVITIVAILGFFALPRFGNDDLAYARDQIINHMRYTQHLALIDDKYLADKTLSTYPAGNQQDQDSTLWYKKMWRIQFHQNAINGLDQDSYSVYSDQPQYDDTIKSSDLVAADPSSGLFLAGKPAVSGGISNTQRADVDVFDKYGVTIDMKTCTTVQGPVSSNQILFDHLGRPYCMPNNYSGLNGYEILSTAPIRIVLTNRSKNEHLDICVEPESGYIHEC